MVQINYQFSGGNFITRLGDRPIASVPMGGVDIDALLREQYEVARRGAQNWVDPGPGFIAPAITPQMSFDDWIARRGGYNQAAGTTMESFLSRQSAGLSTDAGSLGTGGSSPYSSAIESAINTETARLQQEAKSSRPFYRTALKAAVPLAIAAVGTFLGASAVAPGLLSGGAAAGSTASASAGSTGLSAGAAGSFNPSLISSGSGGLLSRAVGAYKAVAPYTRALSAANTVMGLFDSEGRSQRVTNVTYDGGGVSESSEIATRSSAEVEDEERRRRALAASSTNRQSTVRAGSLAQRPVLGAAGLLG